MADCSLPTALGCEMRRAQRSRPCAELPCFELTPQAEPTRSPRQNPCAESKGPRPISNNWAAGTTRRAEVEGSLQTIFTNARPQPVDPTRAGLLHLPSWHLHLCPSVQRPHSAHLLPEASDLSRQPSPQPRRALHNLAGQPGKPTGHGVCVELRPSRRGSCAGPREGGRQDTVCNKVPGFKG